MYGTRIRMILHEMTFFVSLLKKQTFNTLYTSTIMYSRYIHHNVFCLEVDRNHLLAKHFCTRTILDHL
jgi:hypothetical protein